jgi:hypothetical protein
MRITSSLKAPSQARYFSRSQASSPTGESDTVVIGIQLLGNLDPQGGQPPMKVAEPVGLGCRQTRAKALIEYPHKTRSRLPLPPLWHPGQPPYASWRRNC